MSLREPGAVVRGVLCVCLLWGIARGENWPCFRGPTGLGYTTERDLPVEWGGEHAKNVKWRSPLVGQGHASPIVWEDWLVVTTVRWPDSVQSRTEMIPEHHVLCYATRDGQLRWDTRVPPGPWLRTDFRSGPGGGYAAPTPATDGKRIYCAFGSAVIAAVDAKGDLAWRREIHPYTFDVTLGTSPILHGDTVILLCAMAKPDDSSVLAFDAASGEVRWQRRLPTMAFGHSTPVVIEARGRRQMLVLASGMSVAPDALRSLDPDTGDVLWWCRGGGDAASPAYGSGLVYFDSGRGGPGSCVDPTGEGDVTKSHVKWTVPQVPEGIGSPIIVDGRVYRLHQPGILKCWDLENGREVYQTRLDGLSTTWASPVADPRGRIYFANGGRSYVVQAGDAFKVLAINELGDPSHPSPAASGGRLFLVGEKSVHCVGAAGTEPDGG